MTLQQKFHALNNAKVSREDIEDIILQAKKENASDIIFRLSKILLDNPNTEVFEISLQQYPTALNAPHHQGLYKEALTECGRLKKGWKFEKGRVVKVEKPKKKVTSKKKTPTNKVVTKKEVKTKKVVKPKKTISKKPKQLQLALGNPPVNPTLKEAKKYYLAWALENLRGKKYFHKDLQKTIVFNRKGIEHSLSYKTSIQKIKLITQAEELLKKSTFISFENDKKNRRQIKGVYRMSSMAVIDNEERQVLLTLREGENGVIYYDHEIDGIKKLRSTSLGDESPIVKRGNEVITDVPQNKVTKKETKNEPKEDKGLGNPTLPVEQKPKNIQISKNSLAYKLANRQNRKVEFYTIGDKDIADFIGKIERKEKESVVITVTGGQGSMKTRFAFRFMNALAKNYRVGHASIEEHPESTLYWNKVHEYIGNKSLNNISNPEISSIQQLEDLIKSNDVIIIDSFAKMQELERGFEVDKDLRKKYDGKLFLVIFQQTADGKMRGGTKSQYDADIVLFTEKFDDYELNYVYADKNRYQNVALCDLEYNIFKGVLKNKENEQKLNEQIVESLTSSV